MSHAKKLETINFFGLHLIHIQQVVKKLSGLDGDMSLIAKKDDIIICHENKRVIYVAQALDDAFPALVQKAELKMSEKRMATRSMEMPRKTTWCLFLKQ